MTKNHLKARIIVVTGLSGAGKSSAIKSIEDFGGFCVDNMPSALIMQFLNLIKTSDYRKSFIALGVDVRTSGFMENLFPVLAAAGQQGFESKIIFLEANDKAITRRYSESRRRHPLIGDEDSLKSAIEKERERLAPLREKADIIIDTSNISPHELKNRLKDILFRKGLESIKIKLISFGFKYGIPEDIDMLMDTRFLPNPHYVPGLGEKNGMTDEIKEFVMKSPESKQFLKSYRDLLDFLIPNYIKEGRSYLNIGIGCTGGKHRSVVITNELAGYLKEKKYGVIITHRDIAHAAD